MPKQTELVSLAFEDGRYRLCLDKVDNVKGETESLYCFVWRGTKRSRNGFVIRPAYFSFENIGRLLKMAVKEREITTAQLNEFLTALVNS
jgi:hypothetical protein